MTDYLETCIIPRSTESSEYPLWIACLVVLKGTCLGDRILLNKDEITIGRTKNTDICLFQDNGASRMHAVIQRINEQKFLLIDKNSVNGTLVNSRKITEAILEDQDLISISQHILKFISSTSPEQAHYDELYRQTHTDKALQIYNKHYFLTKLDEEINRCQRYHTELSLLLFDVDHFKKVNDTYGHLAGDAVLVQLAELVKQRIRTTDILCRYGGEEFTIIMPHINQQQAYIVAEHIRSLVAKMLVHHADLTIPVTISIGISSYVAGNIEHAKETLIEQADKALYQAKHSGRNKVMLF
jgi:diguanylate cyclase (GGDEF)-like protein